MLDIWMKYKQSLRSSPSKSELTEDFLTSSARSDIKTDSLAKSMGLSKTGTSQSKVASSLSKTTPQRLGQKAANLVDSLSKKEDMPPQKDLTAVRTASSFKQLDEFEAEEGANKSIIGRSKSKKRKPAAKKFSEDYSVPKKVAVKSKVRKSSKARQPESFKQIKKKLNDMKHMGQISRGKFGKPYDYVVLHPKRK